MHTCARWTRRSPSSGECGLGNYLVVFAALYASPGAQSAARTEFERWPCGRRTPSFPASCRSWQSAYVNGVGGIRGHMANRLLDELGIHLQALHHLQQDLLAQLSDSDLQFSLPGRNPTLGAMLRDMGEWQRQYIDVSRERSSTISACTGRLPMRKKAWRCSKRGSPNSHGLSSCAGSTHQRRSGAAN